MIRASAVENMVTPKHFVRFYEDDDALVKEIVYFIGTGLAEGDSGLVVATKAHLQSIEERLTASGCDLVVAREQRQYVSLDAADTLSKFMINGSPDEQRFVSEMGSLLAGLERRHSKVRAFGEMVSLLWAEEQYEAALRLEQLWNDLIDHRACSLFCAYRMSDFNTDTAKLRFKDVCAQHSQALLSGTGPL
ncbi:MAG TPA: MEDS domain-containing protein [Nitrospirales bacterium]|jgi:hypothetical protein